MNVLVHVEGCRRPSCGGSVVSDGERGKEGGGVHVINEGLL